MPMTQAVTYFWIAIGSSLGGLARYACGLVVLAWLGALFPWGTIAINVVGSFIIGFFATLTGPDGRWLVSALVRQTVMIGFCGGYTTFSAFSLETVTLLQIGRPLAAAANVGLSLALCLAAVWLGHQTATKLNT